MAGVLIGGVGYRWMGDASFGLAVCDALAAEAWPEDVDVVDFGYGALYAALDIGDRRPRRLVLVAAVQRGRPPGTLICTRHAPQPRSDEEVQEWVRDAGGGIIELDHLLIIADRFGTLPAETYLVELEPTHSLTGDGLSDVAARRVEEARTIARALATKAGLLPAEISELVGERTA